MFSTFKDLQPRRARLSQPSRLKRYASDLAGFAVRLTATLALASAFVFVAYALAYFARFN